jgi:hypothetical protein
MNGHVWAIVGSERGQLSNGWSGPTAVGPCLYDLKFMVSLWSQLNGWLCLVYTLAGFSLLAAHERIPELRIESPIHILHACTVWF